MTAVAAAPMSAAAPPDSERIIVDDTFEDTFLTETCGVPVTTSVTGFVIERAFTSTEGNLQTVANYSLTVAFTSDFGSISSRDSGADIVKAGPDGHVTLSITGRVALQFSGLLVVDLDADEVIKEPQFRVGERELERACATLSGE